MGPHCHSTAVIYRLAHSTQPPLPFVSLTYQIRPSRRPLVPAVPMSGMPFSNPAPPQTPAGPLSQLKVSAQKSHSETGPSPLPKVQSPLHLSVLNDFIFSYTAEAKCWIHGSLGTNHSHLLTSYREFRKCGAWVLGRV